MLAFCQKQEYTKNNSYWRCMNYVKYLNLSRSLLTLSGLCDIIVNDKMMWISVK